MRASINDRQAQDFVVKVHRPCHVCDLQGERQISFRRSCLLALREPECRAKSLQWIHVELNLTRGAKIWRVHGVRLFWMISRRIQQSSIMNIRSEEHTSELQSLRHLV